MSDKFDAGRIIALETALRDLKWRVETLEKVAHVTMAEDHPSKFYAPSAAESDIIRANYPNLFDHTRCHASATGHDENEVIGAPV